MLPTVLKTNKSATILAEHPPSTRRQVGGFFLLKEIGVQQIAKTGKKRREREKREKRNRGKGRREKEEKGEGNDDEDENSKTEG